MYLASEKWMWLLYIDCLHVKIDVGLMNSLLASGSRTCEGAQWHVK
jgi:hypothetical protein